MSAVLVATMPDPNCDCMVVMFVAFVEMFVAFVDMVVASAPRDCTAPSPILMPPID